MDKDTRFLVIGASGLVGGAIQRELSKTYDNVFGTSRPTLEFRNAVMVDDAFRAFNPDVVFLCAALTHVDYCEERPDLSNEFNLVGPTNVLEAARSRGCKVVFYSSSYVFDGELGGRSYLPRDTVNPINIYGKHKAEMEARTLSFSNHLVIRTIGVIGKEERQKNFGYQVLGAATVHRQIYVPLDQEMNPIHADNLAKISIALVEMGEKGIHHVAGDVCKSKFEFAADLVKEAGVSPNFLIGKMTDMMNQKAARPLNGCLDTLRLHTIGIETPSYDDMVRSFVDDH